ncbi:hypothetical protein [Embleya sp. AB8]|uniref:hypothetical protein n=1 Tax=Embleya sp. AB8 TaxID=3156304 RepID=UPI003C775625
MTAPASLDEALTILTEAIEDTLARLDPHFVPNQDPAPDHHCVPAIDLGAGGHCVPFTHLDPSVDAGALEQALRHALYRCGAG